MGTNSGYLDPLISPTYQDDGEPMIRRANINLIGFTVEEDIVNNAIKITNTGGGGGGSVIALADHAAFRALASAPADGTVIHFQSPPGTYIYDSTSGAGFDDDDNIVLKRTVVSVGAAARAYNAATAVMPTYAAYRLIGALGLFTAYSVLARATKNDGGGGVFAYDSSDTTTADNDGTVLASSTKRIKRVFAGAIHVEWFGAVGDSTTGFDGTDDTVAIYRALIAAAGGVLRFGPKMIYRFRQLAASRNPKVVTRSGNTLVCANHDFLDGQIVVLANTQNPSDPPAGLGEGAPYCVIVVSSSAVSLELTPGSGAITLSDAGTGVHTLMLATGLQPADNTTIDLNGSTLCSPPYANEANAILRRTEGVAVILENGYLLSTDTLVGSLRTGTYTEGYGMRMQDCIDSHGKRIDGSGFWWDPFIFLGIATGCTLERCHGHHSRRNALSIIGGKQLSVIGGEYDTPGYGSDPQAPFACIDVEPENIGGASNVDGLLLDDVYCHDGVQGVIVQQGSGGTRSKKVTLRKVRVDDCEETGINCNAVDGLTLDDCSANGITGVVVEGAAKYGIAATDCSDVKVSNGVAKNCTRGFYFGYNDGLSINGLQGTGRFTELEATKQSVTRSGNKFLATDHGFVEGQALFLTTSGSLPTASPALVVNGTIYVRNPGANDFEFSVTPTGSLSTMSSAGSGAHIAHASGEDCDGLTIAHTSSPTALSSKKVILSDITMDGFAGEGAVISYSTLSSVSGVQCKNNGRNGAKLIGVQGGMASRIEGDGNGREIDNRYIDIYVTGPSDDLTLSACKSKWYEKYNQGTLGTVFGGPDDRVTLDVATTNGQNIVDHFKGSPIEIVSGTGAGNRSTITAVAPIVAYDPTTRIARVNSFAVAPTAGSGYEIRWQNRVAASLQIDSACHNVSILDFDNTWGGPVLDNGIGTRLRRPPPANLIANPSDVSAASWTDSGLASQSNDTITEDGAISTHFISQVAFPYTIGLPTIIHVEVLSANRWAYVQLDATHYANIDASDGTLGTTLGVTAVTEELIDGWFRLSIYVPDGPNDDFRIYMANADNVIAYDGDGVSTLQIRSVNITQVLGAGAASSSGFVPTSRTITTTAPLTIDGGSSASLAANRTLAVSDATTGAVGVVKLAGDLNGTGTAAATPTIGKITGLSNQVTINCSFVAFGASVSAPVITQDSPGSGSGAIMAVSAQDGAASGSTNGGHLQLKAGRKNSAGAEGSVQLYTAGTNAFDVGPVQITIGRSFVSFGSGVTAPVITQDTPGDVNGQIMTIAAQGGGGTTRNGGHMYLITGPASGAPGVDGNLYIQVGASVRGTFTHLGMRIGDSTAPTDTLEIAGPGTARIAFGSAQSGCMLYQHTDASDHGDDLVVRSQGGGTTDKDGGDLLLETGPKTGTGTPGVIRLIPDSSAEVMAIKTTQIEIQQVIKWAAAGLNGTSVGGPGAASALPGDASGLIKPTKYLQVLDSTGATLVIPAFDLS